MRERLTPLDHLDAFNNKMDLLQVTMLARCRCVTVTLSGTTKKWIRQIELETITSWVQLLAMFMCLFQGAHKHATPLSHLASIKQGPNDTLKAYIKHFNDELTTIHNPQENGVIMAVISRVRLDTPFWDKLQKDECKTLAEFYKDANKIMCLETAEKPFKWGSQLPQKRATTMARNERMETVTHLQIRRIRNRRLQT